MGERWRAGGQGAGVHAGGRARGLAADEAGGGPTGCGPTSERAGGRVRGELSLQVMEAFGRTIGAAGRFFQ